MVLYKYIYIKIIIVKKITLNNRNILKEIKLKS